LLPNEVEVEQGVTSHHASLSHYRQHHPAEEIKDAGEM
jgi:hypothetical protein